MLPDRFRKRSIRFAKSTSRFANASIRFSRATRLSSTKIVSSARRPGRGLFSAERGQGQSRLCPRPPSLSYPQPPRFDHASRRRLGGWCRRRRLTAILRRPVTRPHQRRPESPASCVPYPFDARRLGLRARPARAGAAEGHSRTGGKKTVSRRASVEALGNRCAPYRRSLLLLPSLACRTQSPTRRRPRNMSHSTTCGIDQLHGELALLEEGATVQHGQETMLAGESTDPRPRLREGRIRGGGQTREPFMERARL